MARRLSRPTHSDRRPVAQPQGDSPATSPHTDPSPPRAAEAASTVAAALLPQTPSTVDIDDGAVLIRLYYGAPPPDARLRPPRPTERRDAPAPWQADPPHASARLPFDGVVAEATATQVAEAVDAALVAAAVTGAADAPALPPSPSPSFSSSEGSWPAALSRQ